MNKKPVVLDARVLTGSGGGPDKTIINSPRYLDAEGYRMICVYLRHPADIGFESLRAKAARRGVELLTVADHGPFDWRVIPRLVHICQREKVSIWHGHDYKTNALGLVLAQLYPLRLVTTVHGWVQHTSRTPLYYLIDRLSLRFYERIICVSQDLDEACRKAGVPRHKRSVLENGIELDECARQHSIAEAKQSQGIPTQRLVVGAAGRLSSEKGFAELISAVAQLLRAGTDLELRIAGEGALRAQLQQQIDGLHLSEKIHLVGFQHDMRAFYEPLDLFVLSSLREGLPNVLLEAMAYETPVLATRVNGVPDLLAGYRHGRLIEPGSVPALVHGLRSFLLDQHLAPAGTSSGRAILESRFSFQQRMRKLRTIYDQLLGDRIHKRVDVV